VNFTNDQLERYSRHMLLREIGVKGQMLLLESRVLIIGAGGLGSPATLYLAAAGIGTLGLVDSDVVVLSNLQRQILHFTKDAGTPKVFSGKEKINRLNPDVNVITYHERADAANIGEIIDDKNYDFVIDATDNFAAKFLVNDACVIHKKAFSHGGIIKFQGQTMTYVPGQGPCYRCVFQSPPSADAVPSCREAGVLGALAGTIGTIQATEAMKYLLGIGELLSGCLLTYDALNMEFRKIKLPRRKNCPVCGDHHTITHPTDSTQQVCDIKAAGDKV
jgi:molybdopterin/thiamine biosynthesis adenylyltransferase